MARTAWRAYVIKHDLRERGVVTDAEIVDFKDQTPSGDYARGKYFSPVVKFVSRDGAPIQVTSRQWLRPNPYQLGQHVAVRYLPEDPMSADLDGVATGWVFVGALLFASTVALVVASLPFVLAPPASR